MKNDSTVSSNLGLPKLHIPDGWVVSNLGSSDSTFAIKSNSSDPGNRKFTENIVIYKLEARDSAIHVAQRYINDIKNKYSEYRFVNLNSFKSANSEGIFFDVIFKANNVNLASSVYVCNIALQKNVFILTHTSLNEPNGAYVNEKKIFEIFLLKNF